MLDTTARNTLIRRLRALGWSLRAIGAHQEVGISAEAVRKVLVAGPRVELPDDGELVTLASPKPDALPPVGPVEYVGVDDTGSYALFVDAYGQMTTALALWRRTFDPPPVGGPGGQARSWLADAEAQAAAHGAGWERLRANRGD